MFSDPRVRLVLINTLIYAVGSTLLQNAIGLGYALLLDKGFKGSAVVRTIIYLPIIISNLIMGYIWYFIVRFNGGALNDALAVVGAEPVNVLADRGLAVATIVAANTFQYVGVAMVLYLAGLQSIPKSYIEAAILDGANARQQLWRVKLPLLMPSVTVSMTINVIGGLNIFGIIVALTGGGPGYATSSLATIMYKLYFGEQNAGYAAGLGVFMFLLAAILGLTTLRFFRRREVDL
jgi:raffinose/stachyose/melibiose transport system permease protein